MKTLILFLCFIPFLSHAADFVTHQEFLKLSEQEQVDVLSAYKTFVQEASKNEVDLEDYTTQINFSFITNAYAAGNYNCFYAGWPSVKKTVNKKTFCSSPSKGNSDYQSLSKNCAQGQLLCQPALFGSKLCVDISTQSKRNSAFSQCQNKFTKSGRTLTSLAKDLRSGEDSASADELFTLVNSVCKTGFQAKTGMCTNLKSRVAAIRAKQKTSVSVKEEPKKEQPLKEMVNLKKVQVINDGKNSEDTELKEILIDAVEEVTKTDAQVVAKEPTREIACAQCDQIKKAQEDQEVLAIHEASEVIDQSKSTPDDYCKNSHEGSGSDQYSQGIHSDGANEVSINIEYNETPPGNKEKRTAIGYDISAERMGEGKLQMEDGRVVETNWKQTIYPNRNYTNSFNGRGKENSFEILDGPVKELLRGGQVYERYSSTDVRMTQFAFFPRKVVPSIKHRGDKIIMKMTTGEEIVVNAKTGKIDSGAAKDVPAKNPVETRKGGADVRTYPSTDFSYTGDGLYIQSSLTASKDPKEPGSIVSVKANSGGKLQECKVKSEEIWVFNKGQYNSANKFTKWSCAKFKFEKDEELYELVKKKCPSFQFPALVK